MHAAVFRPVRRRPRREPAQRSPAVSVVNWVFLGAVPAVARQERSRPTTCPASSLTRKLLALSLAGLVQLDDSRASAAVALQTLASCVHLERHRLQVQLRARVVCLACSKVTRCWSVPLASLDSLVLVLGLTMCQQCAVGSYSSTEQQTSCDRCLDGSTLVSQDEGCQQCSPGYFRSTLMTNCSSCDAGSFQNTSGQSERTQCSAVLDLQGANPHLWRTMSRIEKREVVGNIWLPKLTRLCLR